MPGGFGPAGQFNRRAVVPGAPCGENHDAAPDLGSSGSQHDERHSADCEAVDGKRDERPRAEDFSRNRTAG